MICGTPFQQGAAKVPQGAALTFSKQTGFWALRHLRHLGYALRRNPKDAAGRRTTRPRKNPVSQGAAKVTQTHENRTNRADRHRPRYH